MSTKNHWLGAGIGVVLALGSALACGPALADIYTWIDASGRVNVSNLAPPEDARVVSVSREDPDAAARAKAARDASQRNDVTALNERVSQLETQLDQARSAPPPLAYPPPPPPAYVPAAYPPIVNQMIVMPQTPQQPYADCGDYWSCGPGYAGLFPGFYPWFYPSVVVVQNQKSHRFDSMHPPHRGPVHPPVSGGLVNALPDPPNLFPRSANTFANVRMH